MAKNTSKKLLAKVFVMSALLVSLVILTSQLENIVRSIEVLFSPREFDFAALEADDAKRAEYYRTIEGFWVHESDSLNDRIEMMDNGIIWQYTQRFFTLPGGRVDTLRRISTSFLRPSDFRRDGNFAINDLRMIREVWFTPQMCFGRRGFVTYAETDIKFPDYIDGEFSPERDTFFFNGVAYTRFEGDESLDFADNIRQFFPEGYLNLLRPNPITFTMPSCYFTNPVLDWLRASIINSWQNKETHENIRAERENLAENYFIPLCLAHIESGFRVGQNFDVNLRIAIAPDGSVDTVLVRGREFRTRSNQLPIINEVMRWRFPPAEAADTISVDGSFIKRRKI